jgi:hypothetical protein
MSGTWGESGYLYRASITVDNSANGTTRDARLTVPADWDAFWSTLADTTNAYDVIVVDPTTNVLVTYQRNAFTLATRALILDLDNVTDANLVTHLWLYWGKAGAANRATPFAFSAGATAYVELGCPGAADLVVRGGRHQDSTPPDDTLVKPVSEECFVWFDLERVLQRRCDPYNSDLGYEAAIDFDLVVEQNGTPNAGMTDDTQLRIIDGRYIRGQVKGGTHANDYTGIFTVTTSLNRTVDYRFRVLVRNPSE